MARSSTSFAEGNGRALKHGARSRLAVQKRAPEVRAELATVLGDHLTHLNPADRPLLDLAIETSVKLRLVSEYLDRSSGGSLIDGRGRPRSCATLYLSLQRQALAIFDRLGVGPLARSQVLGNLGQAGLASQLARRRSELDRGSGDGP